MLYPNIIVFYFKEVLVSWSHCFSLLFYLALTSIAAGSHPGGKAGSFTTVPDGYPGRLSDHVTTSGQPTSTASFSDTQTER